MAAGVLCGAAACVAMVAGASTALGQTLPGRFVRLADTLAGSGSGLNAPDFVVSGSVAYFRAQLASNALWQTNGQPGGTVMIDSGLSQDPMSIGNGAVVYLRSTANVTGPAGVYVVFPGSMPQLIGASGTGLPSRTGVIGNVQVLNGRVLFMAGGALWSWDIATGMVDSLAGPASITGATITEVTIVGGKALVLRGLTTGGAADILATDGTAAGTTSILTTPAMPRWSSSGPALVGDGTTAYFAFTSPSEGPQVWSTDGTSTGSHRVALLPTGALTTSVWSARNAVGVYWTATIGSTVQLWHFGSAKDDATFLLNFAGTLARLNPIGSANGMSLFGDTSGTYSQPTNQIQNSTLWVSMGSVQTTLAALRVLPSGTSGVGAPVLINGQSISPTTLSVGDEVYFVGNTLGEGNEMWHVNTATGSMGVLADLNPGTGSSVPRAVFAIDANTVGIETSATTGANAQGNRVWTVGPAGTRWIASPGVFSTTIRPVTMGHRVLTGLNVAGVGTEPYVLDLCPADYDNSGGAPETADIFAFLNDWLAASPNADFDGSGGAPTTADIFGFINAWMVGCQ
jgi:ELWxxDGT repeat protein